MTILYPVLKSKPVECVDTQKCCDLMSWARVETHDSGRVQQVDEEISPISKAEPVYLFERPPSLGQPTEAKIVSNVRVALNIFIKHPSF